MKYNQLKSVFLILSVAMLVSSCGGGSKEKSSDTKSEFDSANKNKEKMAANISQIMKNLPPPSEVPHLLVSAGADFDATIINSLDNIASYQNSPSKAALNLGVYVTDIGYLASYEESEIALNYMGECQKLAAPIGMASALDYSMVSRFETNMGNKDSLTVIINEVMEKSEERLSVLDELNSVALLWVGSWIEGIYISTEIVNKYPNNLPERSRTLILEPFVKIIMDQKASLIDLLKLMDDIPESEEINNMKVELKKVKSIYENELAEVENQVSENTGGFIISSNTLDNLSSEVKRIRMSFVE